MMNPLTLLRGLASRASHTAGADCLPPPSGLVCWWRAEGNAGDAMGANHGAVVWADSGTFYESYILAALRSTDGGLIRTPDLGMTFDSSYNRNLGNLDFVNPSGARYWYGSLGVSLQGNDLVLGSGSPDNGNLDCDFDAGSSTPSPWLYLGGGDGNLMTFLETGDLLSWHNSDANVRWARWSLGANAFNTAGKAPSPLRSAGVVLPPGQPLTS